MVGLILRFLLNAAALGLTTRFVHGLHADGIGPLLIAALVLGILNAVIRPVLLLLTLPFNILTLGLFTFVVNAAMLGATSFIVKKGFHVDGFWPALIGAIVLSIISAVLNWLVRDRREKDKD
jgi:putative membrane protein